MFAVVLSLVTDTLNTIYFLHVYVVVTRVTRRVPLVLQELPVLPENMGSYPAFSGVFFCVVFCISLFVILSLFFLPLCCLSFELRLLIIPFVFSNLFQNIYLNYIMIKELGVVGFLSSLSAFV